MLPDTRTLVQIVHEVQPRSASCFERQLFVTMTFPIPAEIEVPIHLLGTLAALAVILMIRALLDLEIGVWVIRLLHWVPTRWIFRHRHLVLNGNWEHIWSGDTGRFKSETERHGNHFMYQFFRWTYAGTRSNGKVFTAFGRIQGDYLIGHWYDNHDEVGYFGAFQLRIIDSNKLEGTWIGHSKTNPALIRIGAWEWKKVLG